MPLTSRLVFTLLFTGLAGGLVLSAQTPRTIAPPSDPLEPVTAMAQTVTSVEQRATAVALLNRAADLYSLHAKASPPHVLQIALQASASTLYPAATGQLRETWISGQNWRWDATLGDYSLLRISSNGVAYDEQTPKPMPMRLKMLATAVFAPLQFITPRVSTMRIASVTWKSTPLTCVLLSPPASVAAIPIPASVASRWWSENEFCIDPASGRLNIYSEAPGMYVYYDYANALEFHGKVLPGAVTINENGTPTLQAQLTSIIDTDPTSTAPFTPTSQMKAQGPAVVLFAPVRTRRTVPLPNIPTDSTIEPVIVHATMDPQGNVQESEVLQTTAFSAQALSLVKQVTAMISAITPQAEGTPPRQREAYVTVEFVPLQSGTLMFRSGQFQN